MVGMKRFLIIEGEKGNYFSIPFNGNVKVTTDPVTGNLEVVVDMTEKEIQTMRKKLIERKVT
jgi:hypothetical protein